jgi:galactan endo-1,6-beta-galactosidase
MARSPLASAALLCLLSVTPVASADYTIDIRKNEARGTWEGWGGSICWWGNGVGRSAYESTYADLLFTLKPVSLLNQNVPGLGLSIVRYNVGGGGQGDTVAGAQEKLPTNFPWYKDIDGFWIDRKSQRPESSSYDWTRDGNQRSVLKAAVARGAKVEFFSNAPMWWMTQERSSAGGKLLPEKRQDFAKYLATVVKQAQDNWGVKVSSISPFNEPSAGWWTYPKEQEGANVPRDAQAEILGLLRHELNLRGLSAVSIAASDENAMTEAVATYDFFKGRSVLVGEKETRVSDLINRVNVHGYSGLELWRDNRARTALRTSVGNKPIWMSEVGDGNGGGMGLAQSITEDINHLLPSAWIYWQPIEPFSGWGLVNAKYDALADKESAERAKPTWIYQKYFTFAQFTRFLRPGHRLIGTNDLNTICSYDPVAKSLVLITVNYGTPQKIKVDLSNLSAVGATGKVTVTNTDGPKRLSESTVSVREKVLTIDAEANSVYSTVISGVTL